MVTIDTNIIKSRASIRKFTQQPVPREILADILECGRWAPSGLNNQPWMFLTVTQRPIIEDVAQCTKYGAIVRRAAVCIAVFFHAEKGYHRTKDVLSIGACIENMLLAAHCHGLGACWLGEILNQAEKVHTALKVPPDQFELMAVIALGYPAEQATKRDREPLASLWKEEVYEK